MSIEDTIIASVIYERSRMMQNIGTNLDEARQINRYGRRMIRKAEAKRIRPTDSDEQIAAAITPVMSWLFWQIAPDLLLWIVKAIRHRIWNTQQGLAGER
jgi:hypothetical protein